MSETRTMPALFISHGAPNFIISDLPARHFMEQLSTQIGRPDAIVMVSAHFETNGVAVVTDPAPPMIYDFGGFEPELYLPLFRLCRDLGLPMRFLELVERSEALFEQICRLDQALYGSTAQGSPANPVSDQIAQLQKAAETGAFDPLMVWHRR